MGAVRSLWSLFFLVIFVSIRVLGARDCVKQEANGIVSDKKNISLSGSLASSVTQISLTYTLTKHNDEGEYEDPVLFKTTKTVSGENKTETTTLYHAAYHEIQTEVIHLTPCDVGNTPSKETTIQTLISESPNTNFTDEYNVSVSHVFFDATGFTGSSIVDNCPVCPGRRYFPVDVPSDGFGYNVTIQTVGNHNERFVRNFKGFHLNYETCRKERSDFLSTNVTGVASIAGVTFANLRQGGRWWLSLECSNSTAETPWALQLTLTQTCLLGCLENGFCSSNAPVPFCVCSYFYAGKECNELFSGTYVLIIVGSFVAFASLCYIGYRLGRRVRRDRHPSNGHARLEPDSRKIIRYDRLNDYDSDENEFDQFSSERVSGNLSLNRKNDNV